MYLKDDGIMAAYFWDDIVYVFSKASMISPKITARSNMCLVFQYFNRATFSVDLLYDVQNKTNLLLIKLDGGNAWHSHHVDLIPGVYYIEWTAIGNGEQLPYDGTGERQYMVAIDNVVLHNTLCKHLLGKPIS